MRRKPGEPPPVLASRTTVAVLVASVLIVAVSATLATALVFAGRSLRLPMIFGADGRRDDLTESATAVLEELPPEPWDGDQFLGMMRFDEHYLNENSALALEKVNFVSSEVESTRPKVVSVNPIDDFTWGAAARSAKTGDCFVMVVLLDREDPRRGSFRYERFSGGPCQGTLAVPERVTKSDWPSRGIPISGSVR